MENATKEIWKSWPGTCCDDGDGVWGQERRDISAGAQGLSEEVWLGGRGDRARHSMTRGMEVDGAWIGADCGHYYPNLTTASTPQGSNWRQVID